MATTLSRVLARTASLLATTTMTTVTLVMTACAPTSPGAEPSTNTSAPVGSSQPNAQTSSPSAPSSSRSQQRPSSSGSDAEQAITEVDVIGMWNNHQDTELHQQIRFTTDHQWHEDQHGTTNIYHGTWEITGPRTVMLHDWEEELRFSESNLREFTVVSFDHVLTKD